MPRLGADVREPAIVLDSAVNVFVVCVPHYELHFSSSYAMPTHDHGYTPVLVLSLERSVHELCGQTNNSFVAFL